MTWSTPSVLIGAAVFAAAFGLVAWWFSRRKGQPAAGLTVLAGVSGVHVGFWGVMEKQRWLYVPAVALILSAQVIAVTAGRRAARTSQAPDEPTTPTASGGPDGTGR